MHLDTKFMDTFIHSYICQSSEIHKYAQRPTNFTSREECISQNGLVGESFKQGAIEFDYSYNIINCIQYNSHSFLCVFIFGN